MKAPGFQKIAVVSSDIVRIHYLPFDGGAAKTPYLMFALVFGIAMDALREGRLKLLSFVCFITESKVSWLERLVDLSAELVDVAAIDTLLDALLVVLSFVLFIFGFKGPRFDLLLVDMVYYDTMMSIVLYVEVNFLYIRMLFEIINQNNNVGTPRKLRFA